MTNVEAVLRALRFHDPEPDALLALADRDWPSLLKITDRAQLTLALAVRCLEILPEAMRARLTRDLERNAERHARIVSTCQELAAELDARGIEFVLLKGLSHWPRYVDDPRHRPQYDIDIFCPRETVSAAREAAGALGFEGVSGRRDGPTDHLPTLIRKTGWRWRGDYFDPDLPPSLELHFRFWDPETECFDIDGPQQFWERSVARRIGSLTLPVLRPEDGLSYATLHLLRHLLRGDLRAYHVYELAHFLERSAGDEDFWNSWLRSTPSSFQAIQGIAFRLAAEWFRCDLHAAARETVERLPEPVTRWFRQFSFSPAAALERPNKDELLLHLCLAPERSGRRKVLLRRLLPPRPSYVVADAHVPAASATFALRLRRRALRIRFVLARAWHHARTMPPLIRNWIRWRALSGARALDHAGDSRSPRTPDPDSARLETAVPTRGARQTTD